MLKKKNLITYHSRPVWLFLEDLGDYYIEHSWGCNHCPEATANMTAQCTEGHKTEMQNNIKH